MKILLTGATGFLGSHLLKGLHREGYEVAILKRSGSDVSRISSVISDCTCYDSDKISMDAIFSKEKIDAVIHCATVYGRDGGNTAAVIESNLNFPLRLLDAAIQSNCRYFVNTDTFFCKQLPERLEKGIPLYMPDYTLSKHQFCEWGKVRATEGAVTFLNLRMEHIYGPDDSPGKFIPWLETQLQEGVEYIDMTDGIQQRDFIHVDAVVPVYLHILKNLRRYNGNHYFEVGTGKAISVREFAENLKERYGAKTELRFGKIPRKSTEIMYSVAAKDFLYFCDNS